MKPYTAIVFLLAAVIQLEHTSAKKFFEYPCGDIVCNLGETCFLEDVVCITYPCLPVPSCVLKNPCLTAKCPPGYRCSIKFHGLFTIPQASCKPSWKTCANSICPAETTCRQRPYFPPGGLCVPNMYGQPCQNVSCGHGELCHYGTCIRVQGPVCDSGTDYCDFIL